MEAKSEMTNLIIQIPKAYKKKLKEISLSKDTSMSQLVLECLEMKEPDLKKVPR